MGQGRQSAGFGDRKGQCPLECVCSVIAHIRPLVIRQFGLVCFQNTVSAWDINVSDGEVQGRTEECEKDVERTGKQADKAYGDELAKLDIH